MPIWVGVGGFTVIGAWFAALTLRRDRAARAARHLTISSVGMVLMYLMHHHASAMPEGAGSDARAGHLAAGSSATGLLVLPLTLVLAGYFAWHTWTCVERSRTGAAGSATTSRPRAAIRTPTIVEPIAHGVMSAFMAAMFLGAI